MVTFMVVVTFPSSITTKPVTCRKSRPGSARVSSAKLGGSNDPRTVSYVMLITPAEQEKTYNEGKTIIEIAITQIKKYSTTIMQIDIEEIDGCLG